MPMRSAPVASFLTLPACLLGLFYVGSLAAAPIDRHALVTRHNVHLTRLDPEAPVSVGNGDFAFTADVTGFQNFTAIHHRDGIPLETLSSWAWHSFPNPEGLRIEDAMRPYPFHDRTVRYAALQDSPAGAYFRENPHPIPLGQISLLFEGRELTLEDLGAIDQTLDLWTGVIRSAYTIAGTPVVVETVAHADRSIVAFRVQSTLVARGKLEVRLRFPYSWKISVKNKPPLVWDQPGRHRTQVIREAARFRQLERVLDDSRYDVSVQWTGDATLREADAHDYRLRAADDAGDTLSFACGFAPDREAIAGLTFDEVRASSANGWRDYWTKGGVVDLSGSTDPRAAELERRVVLSQYLVRVNYAGAFPPSESGLTNVTWYGKHNSEMYFWHAAQFYQWGHVDLLERGLAWYQRILPLGKADAAAEGFDGARWPKMAGIDGRPAPGTINPFIIWNAPNPIYLCELVYRARPERATLEQYQEIVFESAKFLASFAWYDAKTSRYVLGPPIKNVSENTGENSTQNPTFELAYWYYALNVAQHWRERLGLPPEPRWADIIAKLSRLPVSDGKYLEIETIADLYREPGDLPTSMMMALGFLPQTDFVDRETARRTFHELNQRGGGPQRWLSWQVGQGALTAARLGEPETAVAIATNAAPAARFMPSGHVRRPKEPEGCPAYLPVNASLLAAVGLMAAGWDGAPAVNAPGFPQDGSWRVQSEGLNRMP